jgi:tetratricopeptide (TPR) repeat protein
MSAPPLLPQNCAPLERAGVVTKVFRKILRVALGLGVAGAILVGAVFLVLALPLLKEGKLVECSRALAGGFVSLLFAWVLGKGLRNARRKAYDLAVAEYTQAICLDPATPIVHHNRGVACQAQHDYAKAVAHFDAAIRLDPTLPHAYVGRVNAYGAVGQFDRVIADYTAALQLDPNNVLAYCARATAYNGLGRFDRSIPDASEAIRLNPRLYLGYDARAYGYMQRGSFNGIVKLLATVWMLTSLGFLRQDHFDWSTPTGSKADYEQALADFTEAIRLNPTAWDCYQGRAQVYRALDEADKAGADEACVRQAASR